MRSNRNPDMLRGTVELLILTALSRGPRHGFGIARWLEATSDDELQIEEGSLYPACTAWSGGAGWRRSGGSRRTTGR